MSAKQSESKPSANVVEMEQPVFSVGADDGHFGIKIVVEGPDGTLIQTYVPSQVAPGSMMTALNDAGDNMYETENGQTFTVSVSLPHIDTRFTGYGYSDINRVLIHHGLMQAGLAGKSVRIVTGLPIDDYFVANKPNNAIIEKKVKSLLEQKVTSKNPSLRCANILNHTVQPEGIAAFHDLLIGNDGQINMELAELIKHHKIAFIDIGGKTTDIAVILNGGNALDPARSGTEALGGLSLNKVVEQRIKDDFKFDQISPAQVEMAVRTGEFRAFQKQNDVSKIVNEEKRVLAEDIQAALKRKVGDGADLEQVYFVGGGSLLLKEQLKDIFPHAIFTEDPQFANARGMFKIAKYILK